MKNKSLTSKEFLENLDKQTACMWVEDDGEICKALDSFANEVSKDISQTTSKNLAKSKRDKKELLETLIVASNFIKSTYPFCGEWPEWLVIESTIKKHTS